MPEGSTSTVTKKSPRINGGMLNTVLLVIIVIFISAGTGYFAGFKMGQKSGAKKVVQKVTDLLNPLNAVSNNPLFPHTFVGRVADINDNAITIKLANKEEKKVALTKTTKVSKQNKVLGIKDVKKDDQVTIFTIGKDSDTTANRVVLR